MHHEKLEKEQLKKAGRRNEEIPMVKVKISKAGNKLSIKDK